MTEYSQIIEDPLFVNTGAYLRALVRHDGDTKRAFRVLDFAVNSRIYQKSLLDPCRTQLGLLLNRVEKGSISRATDGELMAIEALWTRTIVKRIIRGKK